MKSLAAGFLAVALACSLLNSAAFRFHAPGLSSQPVLSVDTAVQSAALLGLGMKRLAADLELVRLLIYYGTLEEGHSEEEWESGGGGIYIEMLPRGRRILALDPSFSYAVQYAAGALAFNLNRPAEATALLTEALARDPRNASYRKYMASVAFAKNGDMPGIISILEPMLGDPDTPAMIENIVAFMNLRLGRRAHALELYRDMAARSKDEEYRQIGRRMAEKLSRPAR